MEINSLNMKLKLLKKHQKDELNKEEKVGKKVQKLKRIWMKNKQSEQKNKKFSWLENATNEELQEIGAELKQITTKTERICMLPNVVWYPSLASMSIDIRLCLTLGMFHTYLI